MVPAGYMAKRTVWKPDWLGVEGVDDIYSLSRCVNKDFTDYINYWKHNGYWLFDSPVVIEDLARGNSIDLAGTKFFYYEVYELEFKENDHKWHPFVPEPSFKTNVILPKEKYLEGYDVVTFSVGTSPECSPLSCNGIAGEIEVNRHCLIASFEQAKQWIEDGKFNNSEPGPYRIFAVYSFKD